MTRSPQAAWPHFRDGGSTTNPSRTPWPTGWMPRPPRGPAVAAWSGTGRRRPRSARWTVDPRIPHLNPPNRLPTEVSAVERSWSLVIPSQHRRSLPLPPEDTDSGRREDKVSPCQRRHPKPACGEDPQHMTVGENEYVAGQPPNRVNHRSTRLPPLRRSRRRRDPHPTPTIRGVRPGYPPRSVLRPRRSPTLVGPHRPGRCGDPARTQVNRARSRGLTNTNTNRLSSSRGRNPSA